MSTLKQKEIKNRKNMEKTIKSCWLSPTGEVWYCNNHTSEAEYIIEKLYKKLYPGCKMCEILKDYRQSPECFLEKHGWIKYFNREGYPYKGWVILTETTRPTKKQLDKMFELTGYIPDT